MLQAAARFKCKCVRATHRIDVGSSDHLQRHNLRVGLVVCLKTSRACPVANELPLQASLCQLAFKLCAQICNVIGFVRLALEHKHKHDSAV